MTSRVSPLRRIEQSQGDTMGRVYPLVTLNKTHRHIGEGRPSPSRPINSNRRDKEGFPLLVTWIPLHLVLAREGWSSSLVGNQTHKMCPDGHILRVWSEGGELAGF